MEAGDPKKDLLKELFKCFCGIRCIFVLIHPSSTYDNN